MVVSLFFNILIEASYNFCIHNLNNIIVSQKEEQSNFTLSEFYVLRCRSILKNPPGRNSIQGGLYKLYHYSVL